jgi:hypothetical protein
MDAAHVEHKGEWWMPERPERRVPGILRIDGEGRCVLDLLGELRPWDELGDVTHQPGGTVRTVTSQHLDDAGRFPRLHGQVGVTAWTLEDCGQIHQERNIMGGLPHERLSVRIAFKGYWYEPDELPGGDRLLAQMQWTSYWVGARIEESETVDPDSHRLTGRSITVHASPTESVQVDDHCELRLLHGIGASGDGIGSRALRHEHWLEISYDFVQPVDVMAARLGTLQPLISLGTGRPAGYESIKLQHPDLTEGPEGRYRHGVEYVANWSLRDRNEKPLQWSGVIFTLADFGGVNALPKWIAVAERFHEPLSRATARHQRDMFVNDQVFHSAAALEGFHKIAFNPRREDLVDRLLACARLGGESFTAVVPDVSRWANLLKDERHEIGHGGLGHLPPEHMLYLGSVSFYLLELCLLRLADAPEVVFTKMSASPRARWLTDTMRDVLVGGGR